MVKVKTVFENDVRRWNLPETDEPLAALNGFLESTYNTLPEHFKLSYVDEDGDRVTVKTNQDLFEAVSSVGSTLKLFIEQQDGAESDDSFVRVGSGSTSATEEIDTAAEGDETKVNGEPAPVEDETEPEKEQEPEQETAFDWREHLTRLGTDEELRQAVKEGVVALYTRLVNGEPFAEALDTVIAQFEKLRDHPVIQHVRGFIPAFQDRVVAAFLPWIKQVGVEKVSNIVSTALDKLKEYVANGGDFKTNPFGEMCGGLPAMFGGFPFVAGLFPFLSQHFGGQFAGEFGHGHHGHRRHHHHHHGHRHYGRGRGCGRRGGWGRRGPWHRFGGGFPFGEEFTGPSPPGGAAPQNGVHVNVECDGCGQHPLEGARFKCTICADFDLCGNCEAKGEHPRDHPLLKINPPQVDNSPAVHASVTCDVCGVAPITGLRFKCTVCPNYDLCEGCETKGDHPKDHPLIKLTKPLEGTHFPWQYPGAFEFLGSVGGRGRGRGRGRCGRGPWWKKFCGPNGKKCGKGVQTGCPFFGGAPAAAEQPTQQDESAAEKPVGFDGEVTAEHLETGDEKFVDAGQTIIKSWTLKNVGKKDWPEGTKIVLVNGKWSNSRSDYVFPVPAAKIGDEVTGSVVIVAPAELGRHRAVYRLETPEGHKFGQPLRAEIIVGVQTEEDVPDAVTGEEFEFQDGLEALIGMGFSDVELNKSLLVEHKGNIESVLQALFA